MITKARAKELLEAFRDTRILVVGDLMLDRYLSGTVSRISPEAPVPVVLVTGERAVPGGAANVALNINSLGGRAIVAGLVGSDRNGDELTRILSKKGINTACVYSNRKVQTTVKTRVIAERQQVTRVDREDPPEAARRVLPGLCRKIRRFAGKVDGVIIEDYGKGVICQETVDAVLSVTRKRAIHVGYDPKDNHELDMKGITLATPNYREACIAAGLSEPLRRGKPESDRTLAAAGRILMKRWRPNVLVITLGPDGMYLLPRGGKPVIIPTRAREVFDVSGAGDTVIAAALLSLAAGASNEEAVSLANYAAGVVVGKLGTATCSPDELLANME